jgi:ATP-dependent helicase/nuclease subunit A
MGEIIQTEIKRLSDQEARNTIEQELNINILIEAGAGSGKTSAMANRIKSLITSGYREIGQIAAITFTKKAASELQNRVRKTLQEEYAKSVGDKVKNDLVKHALDHFHSCYIGTIHSFCGKLLRERPVEAGVDPNFTEIDDAQDDGIRSRIWEDYYFFADGKNQEILSKLDELGISEKVVKNFLGRVSDNQDVQFISSIKSDMKESDMYQIMEDVFNELEQCLISFLDYMPENIVWEEMDDLQKTITKYLKLLKNDKIPTFAEKVKFLCGCQNKSSIKITQKRWSDDKDTKKWIKEEAELLLEFQTDTLIPAIQSIYTFAYNNYILPYVMEAGVKYRNHKKSAGLLNFQDLLMKANELLRDDREMRRYFKNKYKTILVDEFQDTDPIQAQMLMYLTGIDLDEKRWDKLVPEEGSLFVVGDPKQSIYAFRRADIEIYNKFKDILQATGGKCIYLTTNFRSNAALVNWYNDVFSRLMVEEGSVPGNIPEAVKQADFVRLDGLTTGLPGTLSGVEYYKVDGRYAKDIVPFDCHAIGKIIHWLVDSQEITDQIITNNGEEKIIEYSKRKVEYKDIMILSATKKYLTGLSAHLSIEGIPAKVVGADIAEKTPVFLSLANIIRLLTYPEENAYLYEVLTGEGFKLTDYEIYCFVKEGGLLNIYYDCDELEQSNIDTAILSKFKNSFCILREISSLVNNVTGSVLVDYTVDKLGLRKGLLEDSIKITQLSGLQSILEKLRMTSIDDIWSLNDYLTEMIAIINGSCEEEIDLEGETYNAVSIMNLHKSKGLEAPIVILAMPCSGKVPEETFYVERKAQEDGSMTYQGHVKLKLNPDSYQKLYAKSDEWDLVEPIATYKKNLEFVRLLYVAATRAGNALLISQSGDGTSPWSNFAPLFEDKTDFLQNFPQDMQEETEQKEYATEFSSTEGHTINAELDIIDPCDELMSQANINIREAEKMCRKHFSDNQPSYVLVKPSDKRSKHSMKEDFGAGLTDEKKRVLEMVTHNSIRLELVEPANDLQIGEAVHRIFEMIIKKTIVDKDGFDRVIDSVIEKNTYPWMDTDTLKKFGNAFKKSKLYQRVAAAQEIYAELPFSFKENCEGVDSYATGRIDLVFKESNKWVIVDYKTCDEKAVKHQLYYEYLPQLEIYRKALSAVDDCNVTLEVFFVEKSIRDITM